MVQSMIRFLMADHFKIRFITRSVLRPQTVTVKGSYSKEVEKGLTELSVKSWNICYPFPLLRVPEEVAGSTSWSSYPGPGLLKM